MSALNPVRLANLHIEGRITASDAALASEPPPLAPVAAAWVALATCVGGTLVAWAIGEGLRFAAVEVMFGVATCSLVWPALTETAEYLRSWRRYRAVLERVATADVAAQADAGAICAAPEPQEPPHGGCDSIPYRGSPAPPADPGPICTHCRSRIGDAEKALAWVRLASEVLC